MRSVVLHCDVISNVRHGPLALHIFPIFKVIGTNCHLGRIEIDHLNIIPHRGRLVNSPQRSHDGRAVVLWGVHKPTTMG